MAEMKDLQVKNKDKFLFLINLVKVFYFEQFAICNVPASNMALGITAEEVVILLDCDSNHIGDVVLQQVDPIGTLDAVDAHKAA